MALLCCKTELLLQRFQGGGLRNGIGHVEIGGDASCCCRTAFCLHVSLGGQTRLTEVYVAVDDAWQDVAASGINHHFIFPDGSSFL